MFNMEDLLVVTLNIMSVACIGKWQDLTYGNISKMGEFMQQEFRPAVLMEESEMISEENNPIFQRPVIKGVA